MVFEPVGNTKFVHGQVCRNGNRDERQTNGEQGPRRPGTAKTKAAPANRGGLTYMTNNQLTTMTLTGVG